MTRNVVAPRTADYVELGLSELSAATDGIHTVHRTISDRVFSGVRVGLGPLTSTVKPLHDLITDTVYGSVSASLRGASVAAHAVAAYRTQTAANSAESSSAESPTGALGRAFINGLVGDQLDRDGSPLSQSMTLRCGGTGLTADQLTPAACDSIESPSGALVIFAHGLMCTEHLWWSGQRPSYGDRLADDLGASALYLRYNTGRHISENGAALAVLVQRIVDTWPVPVTSVTLIGHSMGGLVIRSACHYGQQNRHSWTDHTAHTICLGSPHLGAPLAQGVHYASAGLDVFPESRPFARLLRRRSGGIRDLHHGSLVDEDWRGIDLDTLRLAATQEVPLLPHAQHGFVSATITRSPGSPVSRLVGDGLVLGSSASGTSSTRRIGFSDDAGLALGSAHHLTLMNNDAVYRWILDRLRSE